MATHASKDEEKKIEWWQLSLLGVAATIGTGFFLGSGIAIQMAGPSVIFAYILAAIGTYFVYESLAKMTIADPQSGSFRTYARKAYGHWAGFSSGWVYWASEILIMGSQLTALAIFTRFWAPGIPLWVFAAVYAALGIVVILMGSSGFDRVENVLAVMKVAAILMFIVLAGIAIMGLLGVTPGPVTVPQSVDSFFPNGFRGLLPALIFGFYGFGGIEIIGLLAMRLKKMDEAPKAGKVMLLVLGTIYAISIGLAIVMVPIANFVTDESPFVTALNRYQIPYVTHVFNGVFIIAGFSTMVASMFAVVRILTVLAQDGDAPAFLGKKIHNKTALPAISFMAAWLVVSVIFSVLMPGKIYEYFTTAAGIMLLYNWIFILASWGRLLELTGGEQAKRVLGFILVALVVTGTLFSPISRPGFFISLAFVGLVAIVTLMMRKHWNKPKDPDMPSLFTKIKR
ncbi:amino acid permease [Alteribacter natronophilus]|uniref:amino acid permease n=1 Tax=Alteribacter natronophilus TaxID=2583810 RepID=UPI00110EB1EA|nr:amino acid permease [Alteribacter natronophilus]TMW72916.1 amino acid permease [Alteribacter natronophilus]